MAGIILAGGKSIRLGEDKAFVRLNSITLLEAVLATVQKVVKETILVVNNPEKFAHLLSKQMKIVKDKIPYQGPLGGILSGLEASADLYNLVVPCDTPFLEKGLLKHLLSQSNDYDVVVPKRDEKLEPLLAVYSKKCIEPIKKSLDNKDLRIVSFFGQVNIRCIKTDIISKYDPEELSFFNINTKEDLDKARRIFLR